MERNMRTGIALLVGVLGGLLALPATASAQEVDYTNTVTVSAGAKVDLEADIATVTFGIRGADKDASAATSEAAERTESVVNALTLVGVTEDELTVGGVRLDRKTDRKGNFLRYVAGVTVKVKTERLGKLGEIIDAAVGGGATSVRGLSYDVKDRSAGVDQALREAMALARAKATALAESEGRTVGPAIVISEYDSRPVRSVSFDISREATGGSAGSPDAAYGALIPLQPPTLSAGARITVTFELI